MIIYRLSHQLQYPAEAWWAKEAPTRTTAEDNLKIIFVTLVKRLGTTAPVGEGRKSGDSSGEEVSV
jgi:hypothetical protein